MNLFNSLRDQLQGAIAQVNPLDRGMTYGDVVIPKYDPIDQQTDPYYMKLKPRINKKPEYFQKVPMLEPGEKIRPYASPTLRVGTSTQMQPFGRSMEDEFTARQYLQPVNYNNGQVTRNSLYMQGDLAERLRAALGM